MNNRPTVEDRASVLVQLISAMADSFQGLLQTTLEPEQCKAHMRGHMNQLVEEALSTCLKEARQFGSGHITSALRAIQEEFNKQK